MNEKIKTLFECIKNLCESDLDRIISFVFGIVSVNQQLADRPGCPYCVSSRVIKYGHKDGKQRFLCKDCTHTFMHTTNTLMANSHYSRAVWADFIRDTLYGEPLDHSAENFGFSHQTAFNMRHKVLMALQNLLEQKPFFFLVLQSLTKLSYLTVTKALLFLNAQGAIHAGMMPKQQNAAYQMNMLQSVPASGVTAALSQRQ